jgi:hypothetical protein
VNQARKEIPPGVLLHPPEHAPALAGHVLLCESHGLYRPKEDAKLCPWCIQPELFNAAPTKESQVDPEVIEQKASYALIGAKKLERLHDSLVKSGIEPGALLHVWEAALELRRLHHQLRTAK